MALTSVKSVTSLELGGSSLEPDDNDKNSRKDLVTSCQP